MTAGVMVGPDGLPRCPWGLSAADYVDYHDEEWGRPLHGVVPMFERVSLEAFQSGLSWLVILRKREGFRRAFEGFDPERVAAFDDEDVARLMLDTGIVRNRAKIAATRQNARAILDLDVPLDELVWSFAPDPDGRRRPVRLPLRLLPRRLLLLRAIRLALRLAVGRTHHAGPLIRRVDRPA